MLKEIKSNYYKYLLVVCIFIYLQTDYVRAQFRENPAVLLAPTLDVFAGSATADEYTIIGTFLIAGGLFSAIVAINFLWVLKQLTFKMLIKVFTVWVIVASGGSLIILVGTFSGPQTIPSRADASSMPRDVRASVSNNVITVQWSTNRPTVGAIKLLNLLEQNTLLSNVGKSSLYHQVTLQRNLDRLEFVVLSDGIEYRLDGKPLIIELP